MSAAATLKDAVERFLYDEARLIDDGRYVEDIADLQGRGAKEHAFR